MDKKEKLLTIGQFAAMHVVQQSAGLIQGFTAVTPEALENMQAQLEAMELGPLLGIFLQSFFVQFTMTALNIVVFVIVYGRMIEIYCAHGSVQVRLTCIRGL